MKEILKEMLTEAREWFKKAELYWDIPNQSFRLGREEAITKILNYLLDKPTDHTS